MNEKLTRKEILSIIAVLVLMIGSMVYGYFILKTDQQLKKHADVYFESVKEIEHE